METSPSYYNSTGESGNELKQAQNRAKKQDEMILAIFQAYPESLITPFECHLMLREVFLLTSVRRGICNLEAEGKLIKTNFKKSGGFGAKNFTWKLATAGSQLTLL